MRLLKIMKKMRRMMEIDLNLKVGRDDNEYAWGRREQKKDTEKI